MRTKRSARQELTLEQWREGSLEQFDFYEHALYMVIVQQIIDWLVWSNEWNDNQSLKELDINIQASRRKLSWNNVQILEMGPMDVQYKKQGHIALLSSTKTNQIKMGAGGTTTYNQNINDGMSLGEQPVPECSSAFHIANKQYVTYPFPSVSHVGINSTKILPSAGQYLGSW